MKISLSHTTSRFEKDFIDLPSKLRTKAVKKIKLFENDCFNSTLSIHKLKGIIKNFWSFSVDRNYRVIFRFLPNWEVIYYRIGSHSIYKELEKMF